MTVTNRDIDMTILYVAGRLPELSETFVYRELCGLRSRGCHILGASVRTPRRMVGDPLMSALADEMIVIYSARTYACLPFALVRHPLLCLIGIGDAFRSDHTSLRSRFKHVFQAIIGISLATRLRNHGIGHVHAHMAHVPATIGLYVARALGASFSFTGHAADLFVQRAALKFKLEQANFVACISVWHRHFYQAITNLPVERLPVVRCSVALPGLACTPEREVVTVARLVPKKGIDVLLRAFALAALPGWRLRIIGEGPERIELERLSHGLGINSLVTFDGAVPHNACLSAIARAGIFILPCKTATNGDQDGIPVALMEAMAASRPVICGDLPTIRELIDDGRSGVLVPQGDSAALATAISRVANDDRFAAALGSHARDHVAAEFSDSVNLDRLCAAFEYTTRRPAS